MGMWLINCQNKHTFLYWLAGGGCEWGCSSPLTAVVSAEVTILSPRSSSLRSCSAGRDVVEKLVQWTCSSSGIYVRGVGVIVRLEETTDIIEVINRYMEIK